VRQERRTSSTAQPETVSRPNAGLPAGPETEAALAKVRADRADAEARSKALEDQLTKVASELEALRAQNEETSISREQLEKKLKEAEQVANAVKGDLQELRQARSKDSLTIVAQDLDQKLSDKLTEQTEMLARERTLLEASRDIHELMGAQSSYR